MKIDQRTRPIGKSSPMRSYRLLAGSVVATMLVSAQACAAGDAAQGKVKSPMCEGCHGIADYRTAYPEVYAVPKLGGQKADYIVKTLQDYKSEARKHPSMRGIAAGLSDQDMADLAAYYSSDGGNSGK